MQYILGSRASALALAQTRWVQQRLQAAYPQHSFVIRKITTKGDLVLDRPMDKVGGKGIFVREIEQQLLDGEVHIGVHSLKDMPTQPPEGLCYTRFWQRENSLDALILPHPVSKTADDPFALLPQGAKIGTGSKRRIAQIRRHRPDIECVPIRGNINTRLDKMHTMQLDGLILAAAGLHRLGLQENIAAYFSPQTLTPAPGQGTLALEIRADDAALMQMLDALRDEQSNRCAAAERAFLQAVDGGCHLPVGAYCQQTQDRLHLTVFLGNSAQTFARWETADAPLDGGCALAKTLAEKLLQERGADE